MCDGVHTIMDKLEANRNAYGPHPQERILVISSGNDLSDPKITPEAIRSAIFTLRSECEQRGFVLVIYDGIPTKDRFAPCTAIETWRETLFHE